MRSNSYKEKSGGNRVIFCTRTYENDYYSICTPVRLVTHAAPAHDILHFTFYIALTTLCECMSGINTLLLENHMFPVTMLFSTLDIPHHASCNGSITRKSVHQSSHMGLIL
jgi:hypothetical protein